jgi:2-keto-4-pentenoate hydratase/2-oxohepta-3-ene-1,7-dioic acid hydratase in catechol pathway
MRLITYRTPAGHACLGAWIDQDRTVVDVARAMPLRNAGLAGACASMQALIEAGERAWDAVRELLVAPPEEALLPTQSVHLLAPVPVPVQMRDALAFELHLRQAKRASAAMRLRDRPPDQVQAELERMAQSGALDPAPVWFRQPLYYKANRFTVIGDGADVRWPSYSKVLDYELEFGVFIGQGGRDIAAGRARAHIFGYSVFNDVSARDVQADEMSGMLGPAKGKDFDTGNVIGPCIVTADELRDPYALTMVARVNGQEWSRGHTSTMRHRFEDIIAHVSRDETLHPGEFIGSGTVGNGCGFELGRFPQPGDVVELEVEGIGRLRNRYVRS